MVYQFKITLDNVSDPVVWRRFLVPSEITFEMFDYILQEAMGWTGYESYAFMPNGYDKQPWILDKEMDDGEHSDTIEAATVRISQYLNKPGDRIKYMYDMVYEWIHEVELEEIDKFNIAPSAILLEGGGACPPEECGGPLLYKELKTILADKNHPLFAEKTKWIIDNTFHTQEELLELQKEDVAPTTVWDPNEYVFANEKRFFDRENKNVIHDVIEE